MRVCTIKNIVYSHETHADEDGVYNDVRIRIMHGSDFTRIRLLKRLLRILFMVHLFAPNDRNAKVFGPKKSTRTWKEESGEQERTI